MHIFKSSAIVIGLSACLSLDAAHITIEPFQPDRDKDAVFKIMQEDADVLTYEALGYKEGTTEKYLMSPNYITDVLRVDGQTVGFINYFHRDITFLTFFIQRAGGIHLIGVDKNYRHQGYGRQLVNHAVAELKKYNVPKIGLDVKKENASARKLYENIGFRCLVPQDCIEQWPSSSPLAYQRTFDVPAKLLPQGNWIQCHPRAFLSALGLTAGAALYAIKHRNA